MTAEIGRLEDQNNILYNDLKNIREQIKKKYYELKEVKAEINEIKGEMSKEEIDTSELKAPEVIKGEYDNKIDSVKQQREDLKQKIDKLKDDYFKKLNHYEDYFDLTSYIKMVTE